MSAISGIVNLQGAGLDKWILDDFAEVMNVQKHRGPDYKKVCAFGYTEEISFSEKEEILAVDFNVKGLLGYNGLVVNEKMSNVLQPFISNDKKVTVAYDGEIYNANAIKEELIIEGYVFDGESIAEILQKKYRSSGFEQMVCSLNGVFTIVVVDLQKRIIYVAGDRYGAKPLYYTAFCNKFAFSSEMKGLIQYRDFERKINIDAYNARLVFARPGSKVLLDGVSLLEPGQIISIPQDGKITFSKYFSWDVYERDEKRFITTEEAIAATEEMLEKAVDRQMENCKMGVQLSGGIDSTLLAYYAKKKAKDDFTEAVAIVDGTGDEGEEYYINFVANKLNMNLHKFQMTPQYFMDKYEKMVWHNDAPTYRPYFACFMKMGELAKDKVSVLFCGEGADEIAGGYSRFAAGALYPFVSQMGLNGGKIKSYDSYARYAAMSGETITSFLTTEYKDLNKLIDERIDLFHSFKGSDFTKHLKFEIRECLPEASLRQEKMTMASSIENRVPFLDNDLVDFLMTLPEDLLVRFIDKSPLNLGKDPFTWMQGKWVLKEVVSKHFGRDFAYRKKMIMNMDERKMVTTSMFVEYFYDLIYPKMKSRGLVDAEQIRVWFDNVNDISAREFTSMWRAISLETWCHLFMDSK